jgi:hypothetical protein
MDEPTASGPAVFVARLLSATNAHDLDEIVSCFADDYRNETPAHPERGFRGRDQVRRNWEQIIRFIPDLEAKVLSQAVVGETVWTEWEQTGTRADGTAHLLRGVILFGVRGGLASWARFYIEPVETGSGGVDAAVQKQVAR